MAEEMVSKNFIEQEIDKDLAEGVYDIYPEYFNNQLRLMNEQTLKEKSLKEKKSKKKGC